MVEEGQARDDRVRDGLVSVTAIFGKFFFRIRSATWEGITRYQGLRPRFSGLRTPFGRMRTGKTGTEQAQRQVRRR